MLSSTRYLNQYFKFTFELPAVSDLRAIPEPASRDGSVQILELASPPPADAEISISAVPLGSGKNQDAKAFLREALDQELYRGVEELRGLSKVMLSGHQFYLFETRRGIDQHMLLATTLDGYIVQVVLAAHDEKVLKQLESSFEHLVFVSPSELKQYQETGARPYDGPSTSSHRLAALAADPPIGHLDPGKIRGDFYENSELGFSYRIPQGWTLEAEGAVAPAVERSRTRENFGRPEMGPTERKLVEACSRTLFSAWEKRPGDDGQIAYDDFGEVTVSATSLACFPEVKFPQDVNDRQAFKDFILEFRPTHPILTDMRDGKAFTAGGNIFLFLHGMVAFQVPNDPLSRRLSIALAVTQRRGYLLTWFFAAPHDSELLSLTDERVSFDPDLPMKAANSPQPGGGESSANASPQPVAASSSASPTATTAQPAPAGSAPASLAAPTAASGDNAASASPADPEQQPSPSSPPSLLRPGETMESQQGKGAPIKKK
ncbi:MAG: hypothetical protein WA655_23145 [Candidatus Korobacteraceae bacterium]